MLKIDETTHITSIKAQVIRAIVFLMVLFLGFIKQSVIITAHISKADIIKNGLRDIIPIFKDDINSINFDCSFITNSTQWERNSKAGHDGNNILIIPAMNIN